MATLVLIAAIEKVSPQEIDLVQKASTCVLELSNNQLSNFELIFIASDVGNYFSQTLDHGCGLLTCRVDHD